MSVLVDPADLLDMKAIALVAGTTPGMVSNWRRRPIAFPEPVAVLSIGPIWLRADVEAWLARPRRSGRPTKA